MPTFTINTRKNFTSEKGVDLKPKVKFDFLYVMLSVLECAEKFGIRVFLECDPLNRTKELIENLFSSGRPLITYDQMNNFISELTTVWFGEWNAFTIQKELWASFSSFGKNTNDFEKKIIERRIKTEGERKAVDVVTAAVNIAKNAIKFEDTVHRSVSSPPPPPPPSSPVRREESEEEPLPLRRHASSSPLPEPRPLHSESAEVLDDGGEVENLRRQLNTLQRDSSPSRDREERIRQLQERILSLEGGGEGGEVEDSLELQKLLDMCIITQEEKAKAERVWIGLSDKEKRFRLERLQHHTSETLKNLLIFNSTNIEDSLASLFGGRNADVSKLIELLSSSENNYLNRYKAWSIYFYAVQYRPYDDSLIQKLRCDRLNGARTQEDVNKQLQNIKTFGLKNKVTKLIHIFSKISEYLSVPAIINQNKNKTKTWENTVKKLRYCELKNVSSALDSFVDITIDSYGELPGGRVRILTTLRTEVEDGGETPSFDSFAQFFEGKRLRNTFNISFTDNISETVNNYSKLLIEGTLPGDSGILTKVAEVNTKDKFAGGTLYQLEDIATQGKVSPPDDNDG